MQARTCAARILARIFSGQQNLSMILPRFLPALEDKRDRALAQELSYGVMRWYHKLDYILSILLNKPLKSRDMDIKALLLAGLYQFEYTRIPPHAIVSATVDSSLELRKPWAKGLVNALLRKYQKDSKYLQEKAFNEPTARFSMPRWLLCRLQNDYPEKWREIAIACNSRPPMTLRINPRLTSPEQYSNMLKEAKIDAEPVSTNLPQAIRLIQAVDVDELPGFYDGLVSVQDLAAQFVPVLMDLQPSQRILDACAAPGGKLAHILETEPGLGEVVAIEPEANRCERLQETISRLKLRASIHRADARDTESWWNQIPFDRILIDAPCSATGVIRRHPDIKYLRQANDVQTTVQTQRQILSSLWPLLRSGGKLLYVTCSILSEENDRQAADFLDGHNDAKLIPIDGDWGHQTEYGKQTLPGDANMDGFYYACFQKS